jgi:hypothetical protein
MSEPGDLRVAAATLGIPVPIARRLVAFLAAGRTGQVALNIHQGLVVHAEFKERIMSHDVGDRVDSSA